MHRIDLKNVNIHTDLVIEQINDKNLRLIAHATFPIASNQ